MPAHVFVDETKERCYLVAAAALQPSTVAAARRVINGLVMPRQRRIHFMGESNARRDKILSSFGGLGITAVIYDASRYGNQKNARVACLKRLVADLGEMRAERLVLERDDSAVQADRTLLFQEVRRTGIAGNLQYTHMRAHEECLLAIPDAIAWCWARGGEWRTKVAAMVDDVREV